MERQNLQEWPKTKIPFLVLVQDFFFLMKKIFLIDLSFYSVESFTHELRQLTLEIGGRWRSPYGISIEGIWPLNLLINQLICLVVSRIQGIFQYFCSRFRGQILPFVSVILIRKGASIAPPCKIPTTVKRLVVWSCPRVASLGIIKTIMDGFYSSDILNK